MNVGPSGRSQGCQAKLSTSGPSLLFDEFRGYFQAYIASASRDAAELARSPKAPRKMQARPRRQQERLQEREGHCQRRDFELMAQVDSHTTFQRERPLNEHCLTHFEIGRAAHIGADWILTPICLCPGWQPKNGCHLTCLAKGRHDAPHTRKVEVF